MVQVLGWNERVHSCEAMLFVDVSIFCDETLAFGPQLSDYVVCSSAAL